MQSYHSNVLARPDTLLGVCQALGEDFGFNPLFLRVAFAAPLLWDPVTPIAVYLALGVLVAASRLIYPNPRAAAAPQAEEASLNRAAEAVEPDAAQAASRGVDARDLAVAA